SSKFHNLVSLPRLYYSILFFDFFLSSCLLKSMMSYLFALMEKTTHLEHSKSRYLSNGNICGVMLMATLLSLTETKTMLPMLNGKSKMHKSWRSNNVAERFQLEQTLLPLNMIVSPSLIHESLVSGPTSCIETFYHHWMHVSMIYYMKNNPFLHSKSFSPWYLGLPTT
ncbi:hypothetical protein CR513_06274, partial [Mucuna pruriens]